MGTGRARIGLLLALSAAVAVQLPSALSAGAQGVTTTPCQQAPTPGDTKVTLVSSGVERTAILHVPPAAIGQPLPLLVGLHGAGGEFFERYSGFSVLADAEGFIAVYPDPIDAAGHRTFWNIDDRQAHGGPDDVQFISDLLDYVERNLCVDTSRVYAAGVSNGGGMATRAVCQLSGRFAAFASIAGGYAGLPPCRLSNPVSVIEVHGTEDGTVPYDGSPPDHGGAVWPWLASWRRHDGCHGPPAKSLVAPRVARYVWTHCAEGTEVEHVKIFGGKHQLPGGLPPDRGQTSTISAAWLAWSFLRQEHQAAPYAAAARGQAEASRRPPPATPRSRSPSSG